MDHSGIPPPIANRLIAQGIFALVLDAATQKVGVVRGDQCWVIDMNTGQTGPCEGRAPRPPRKRRKPDERQ